MNEIITSSAKTVDSNGSPEFPWMVDGVGLPPNASELLPELVMFCKCSFESYFLEPFAPDFREKAKMHFLN